MTLGGGGVAEAFSLGFVVVVVVVLDGGSIAQKGCSSPFITISRDAGSKHQRKASNVCESTTTVQNSRQQITTVESLTLYGVLAYTVLHIVPLVINSRPHYLPTNTLPEPLEGYR